MKIITTTNVLLAVLLALAVYGTFFVNHALGSSAAGSTFNSAKVAEIVMVPTSASATSSSILNTDANDRIVDSAFVSCATSTGSVFAQNAAGVPAWQWVAATTTTSAPATLTNSNYVFNIAVATSTTDDAYQATSTSWSKKINQRWPTGTYLTIQPNATTSNATVSCQAGVYYHGT